MMKKLGAALLIFFGLAAPACAQGIGAQPIYCNQVTTGTAATQIATAVAGKSISVCGYTVDATAAAAAFQLSYGTGATCGTGTVALTPAFAGTGQGSAFTDHLPTAYVSVPATANLCVTTSTNSTWAIYWGQF